MLRRSGGKKHDRSGDGEESYTALCVGCEGSERNGTMPLRSQMLYCVKSGWWMP